MLEVVWFIAGERYGALQCADGWYLTDGHGQITVDAPHATPGEVMDLSWAAHKAEFNVA